MNKKVNFRHTNESLMAIMKGLGFVGEQIARVPKGRTLGIGGSGDFGFAASEFGKVTVVDYDETQTEFMKERRRYLEEGNFRRFMGYTNGSSYPKREDSNSSQLVKRNRYFSERGRFERIRQNLDNLEILQTGDILDLAKSGRFSRVYLSNILGYRGENSEPFRILGEIAESLPKGGVIYVAQHQGDKVAGYDSEVPLNLFIERDASERWQKT